MGQVSKLFYWQYDMDATTYKYQRYLDNPSQGRGAITTSGSSTTVTAVTSAQAPFGPVNVGDILVVYKTDTSISKVRVTAKASNVSITVSSAVDLENGGAGYGAWFFIPREIGTAATSGWHSVRGMESRTLIVDVTTVSAAGGIDMQIEGRADGAFASPVVLLSRNYATAPGSPEAITITEDVQAIRVGLKGGSGFAGTDSVTIELIGKEFN